MQEVQRAVKVEMGRRVEQLRSLVDGLGVMTEEERGKRIKSELLFLCECAGLEVRVVEPD